MNKNRIFNFLKSFSLVTIPTCIIIFLILELFFRFVIPASDPPIGCFDKEHNICNFCNKNESGLFTIGKFAQIQTIWTVNNYGWNFPIDYHKNTEEKKIIAVIGDSFVEAFQVNSEKSYPYLLRKKLMPEYDVFAFGISGSPFSQYLNMSRYVNELFDPDILIFNIVHNDFTESIKKLSPGRSYFMQLVITDQKISETTPRPKLNSRQYNTWKRIISRSSVIRYIYNNLKMSSIYVGINNLLSGNNRENKFEGNINTRSVSENRPLVKRSVDYIIGKIVGENSGKRIIFVLDAPRKSIYENSIDKSKLKWLHTLMAEQCNKHNVELLDLTEHMVTDYKKNGIRYNSGIDYHWNEYGHSFISDIVYDFIIHGGKQ